MKNRMWIEFYILLSIGIIFALFQAMLFDNDKNVVGFESTKYGKVISISCSMIEEQYDENRQIIRIVKDIDYVYPDRLRVETYGDSARLELYDGRYITIQDKRSGVIRTFTQRKTKAKIPEVLEISEKLCKIIETGEYSFQGYEEKDGQRLKIISVHGVDDDFGYIKYWIMNFDGILLPYVEERFVNDKVVSKTSYIYHKINDKIDDRIFKIDK